MPASFRMTSLGEVQPDSSPVSLTPITLGHLSAQATAIGSVGVSTNHKKSRESVVLEDDLMNHT